ncbi:hypothetical protein BCM19_003108 [Clostridium beijerinckii]|nr:hypothetical protein [Clostridium beijerinckii]
MLVNLENGGSVSRRLTNIAISTCHVEKIQ